MKTSLIVGTFLLAGAGASSLGALPNPYQGSDTLLNFTIQALASLHLPPNYIGGGSGNGQTAMTAGLQVTAPMSRMLNNGAGICGLTNTEAQGIVVGLDAVDVLSSSVTGGTAACNSPGGGLVQSGSITANGTTVNFASWKTVLAIVYGGEKDATNNGQVICNGPQRTALVSNWSNHFQTPAASCNTTGGGAGNPGDVAACGDSEHQTCTVTRGALNAAGQLVITPGTCTQPASPPLWHAFRRDDQSGTSDVFATILGIAPNTSATSNNGFGASPYCNAMNWDVTAANTAGNCTGTGANGPHGQFTGPGGVYNSLSGEVAPGQIHRRPPPNTWGDFSASVNLTDADVEPTSMQDNDPIRRPCLGTTRTATKEIEEVCNIDIVSVGGKSVGQLGLVVAVPDVNDIVGANPGQITNRFPTNLCTTYATGALPSVYNCAPTKTTKHVGECPNGDLSVGGKCEWPVDNSVATSVTPSCESAEAKPTKIVSSRNSPSPDARSFNLWYPAGTGGATPTITIAQQHYTLAVSGGGTTTVAVDSMQGMGRIHVFQNTTLGSVGCASSSATDQIGCHVAADQCSIGYAGDAAKTWGDRAGGVASNNAALLVANVAPTTTTVQALGKAGEYQLSRKLYFNTVEGWNAVSAGGAVNADELTLATNEATKAFTTGLLGPNGFFNLGPQSPQTADTPFCEDFNQQTVCAAASNDNACSRNAVAGIPSETAGSTAQPVLSTVCGDGFRGAYEECDDGANNGHDGICLATCRCAGVFSDTATLADGMVKPGCPGALDN
jgi:hypothetical protein